MDPRCHLISSNLIPYKLAHRASIKSFSSSPKSLFDRFLYCISFIILNKMKVVRYEQAMTLLQEPDRRYVSWQKLSILIKFLLSCVYNRTLSHRKIPSVTWSSFRTIRSLSNFLSPSFQPLTRTGPWSHFKHPCHKLTTLASWSAV